MSNFLRWFNAIALYEAALFALAGVFFTLGFHTPVTKEERYVRLAMYFVGLAVGVVFGSGYFGFRIWSKP